MYERFVPQKAPQYKIENVALVGGSIALVAIVVYMKSRKKKGTRKK